VRQAQLGASYRVPCPSIKVGSPHRAKLNQQPVPSVAPVAESTWRLANKIGEAYTGNTVGRRGAVPPLSNSAPLGEKMQLATVLTCRKPEQSDRIGEISRDCRGPRAWHVVREASGTWETLSPPPIYRLEVGRINRKKSVRRD